MKEKTFNKIIIFIVSLIIFSGIMLFAILLVFPLIIPTEIYEKIYDYLLIGDLILGITAIYIHVTLSTLNVKSESDIFKTKKADAYKFKINSSNYSTVYNDIVAKLTEQKYKLTLEKKYDNEKELNIYEKNLGISNIEFYAIIRMKEFKDKTEEEIDNDLHDLIETLNSIYISLKIIIIVDKSTERFKEYLFTNCLIEERLTILPTGIELNTKSLYVHKQNDSMFKSAYKYMRDSFIYIMKLNPKNYTILKNTTEEKSNPSNPDQIIKLKISKDYIVAHIISTILYFSGLIMTPIYKNATFPLLLSEMGFAINFYENVDSSKFTKKKKVKPKKRKLSIGEKVMNVIYFIFIAYFIGAIIYVIIQDKIYH